MQIVTKIYFPPKIYQNILQLHLTLKKCSVTTTFNYYLFTSPTASNSNSTLLCGQGISTIDKANGSMTAVGVILAILAVMYARYVLLRFI